MDEKENIDFLSQLKSKGKYELIIKPIEGIQTTFYSIKERGGKIGQHSVNQIVILEESVSAYHAQISFKNNKFFLKDIGSKSGTFIKIHSNITLEEKMIIEIASNQFCIESIINNMLKIIVFQGINQGEILNICLKDESSEFLIGREYNNDLNFNNKHLSNLHARIYFLNDKFIFQDLSSTNGFVIYI